MNARNALLMLVRYGSILLLSLGNLYLIYAVFTPLTVYPVFAVLKVLYNAQYLVGDVIYFKGYYAEIIKACVAGAAYYFLILLNLSTPMNALKRVLSLIILLGGFLIINVLRIIIFAKMFSVGYDYFDLVHALTWYIGSTVLVAGLWFATTKLLRIEEIPMYSDITSLYNAARRRR
jgi:exosortase/archaeosortase